jgi:hypothetical protein
MSFGDALWAGRVAPGLWIESFSVRPLERFTAQDIEYKGLTGSGFETSWLSNDKMCGTRGMAVPLVGFAVRLKPSPAAAAYDCEYSGYFQSGLTIGSLRNGAPCRSAVANDPLEGIQIRLVRRVTASVPLVVAAAAKTPLPPAKPRRVAVKGSSGSHARKANGAVKAAASAQRKSAARVSLKSSRRHPRAHPPPSRSARSTRRPSTRRP